MIKFRNEEEAMAWVRYATRPATNLGQADAFIEDYRERLGEPAREPAHYCQFEDCTIDPCWCEEHVREMVVEARLEGKRDLEEVISAGEAITIQRDNVRKELDDVRAALKRDAGILEEARKALVNTAKERDDLAAELQTARKVIDGFRGEQVPDESIGRIHVYPNGGKP